MKKTISVIALALCVLIAAMSFAACGASKLVGTWESIEAPGTSFTFNKDGTGSMQFESGMSMDFTYTEKDGKLDITYSGMTEPQSAEYTIENDVLSITDSEFGSTLTYQKQK